MYIETCKDCGVEGYVEVAQDGFKYPDRICEVCNGKGEIEHDENSQIGGDYSFIPFAHAANPVHYRAAVM